MLELAYASTCYFFKGEAHIHLHIRASPA